MKNSLQSFVAGAVVGIGVGIGAAIFLNSKYGRHIKENIEETMGEFYEQIQDKAQELKEMGQEQYEQFMKKAVKKFSQTKRLSQEAADFILEEAERSWDYFANEWGR